MRQEFKIYLVGGAVRDELLGISVSEKDYVVVGATPEQLLAQGFKLVGKDFPVFLHPETYEEYALARTERKIGPGYKGFACYAAPDVSLEDDLKRRDLTINAMAKSNEGEIIDPFGGQKDLAKKLLRHVSPAFSEDPVRILRIARFAARYAHLGFRIADETMELMRQMVIKGEVNELVPERVWQEFARALQETDPQEFILALRNCGALEILFPEIDRLFGVPNPIEWHPEVDTGLHVMMVLQQATKLTKNPIIRFAALLHDLGKGTTPSEILPHHNGHEMRGVDLIKNLSARYLVPADYRDLAVLVSQYHGHVHRVFELKATTLVQLLEKLDAFRRPDRFRDFLLACEADFRGRTGYEQKPYPNRDYMLQAFKLAAAVDVHSLIEQGFSGKLLGDKLHEARVSAVKTLVTK